MCNNPSSHSTAPPPPPTAAMGRYWPSDYFPLFCSLPMNYLRSTNTTAIVINGINCLLLRDNSINLHGSEKKYFSFIKKKN